MHYLEFERPIAELEGKIVELRKLAEVDPSMDIGAEVERLENRAGTMVADTYARLTAWQTQIARPCHVPDYWIVDLDARLFERWTPGDERPEAILDT